MALTLDGTLGSSLSAANSVPAGALQAASVVAANLNGNQSGSAPIYGCRAWCNFDGTLTGTNAPRAGGNVTSVTRNGTGDYTINFTVSMQDANYSVVAATTDNTGISKGAICPSVYATGSTRVTIGNTGNSANYDSPLVSISIFR